MHSCGSLPAATLAQLKNRRRHSTGAIAISPRKGKRAASPDPSLISFSTQASGPGAEDGAVSRDASSASCFGLSQEVSEEHDVRPEVLRGADLSYVLSGAGALWRTSPVDMNPKALEAVHGHSRPCDGFDFFLSQSWASPGWEKYLALLVHFYWRTAAVAGFASSVALFLLDVQGLLPTFTVEDEAIFLRESVEICPWGIVPPLVSLAVLLLGPAIHAAAPRLARQPLVFFDAVCINQNDEELKVEAIYSLTDFVVRSSQLAVMWTPTYLRRLWCVHELAAFSVHADTSRILWLPVFKQRLFFFLFCSTAWNSCCLYFSMSRVLLGSMEAILHCCLPLQMYLIVRVYMPYVKEMHNLGRQFDEFDVSSAECREPADRVYIMQGIVDQYGSLDHFNRYVRGSLKAKVLTSMPRIGMDFQQLAGTMSPLTCLAAQLAAAHIRTPYEPSAAAAMSITWAVHLSVVNPIIFKAAFMLSTLAAKHCAGRTAEVLCSLVIMLLLCAMHVLALALAQWAKPAPGSTLAYCALVCLLWRAAFRR